MGSTLLLLDEPQPLSRRSWLRWWALGVGYLLLTIALSRQSADVLAAIPTIPVAIAWAMSVVAVTAALVIFGHASRSGRRGYLILGASYTAVGILLAAMPLVFPGGLLVSAPGAAPEPLLGGVQSSITLFYLWHFVLVVGVPIAALVLGHDVGRGRPPGLRHGVLPGVLAGAVPAVAAVAVVALRPDVLPEFVTGDVVSQRAGIADVVLLLAALLGVAATLWASRTQSSIGRWLLMVATISLGQAIVNVNAERYSLGWYFERAFGFVAMFVLLIALVVKLGEVDRSARRLATSDTLTDVSSRGSLLDLLAREIQRARVADAVVGLLYVDLDGFKGVNDQFGHAAGDAVLLEVVARIRHEVRATDTVGRLGGDEFAVVLTDLPARDTAVDIAHRIAHAIAADLDLEPGSGRSAVAMTASVGLAFFPDDGDDVETLLQRADSAMYGVKRAGGDGVRAWGAVDLDVLDLDVRDHDVRDQHVRDQHVRDQDVRDHVARGAGD